MNGPTMTLKKVGELRTVTRGDSDAIANIGVVNQDSVNRSAELAADRLADLTGEVLSPELRQDVAKLFGAEYPERKENPRR